LGFTAAVLAEPTTYREAATHQEWQHAMAKEITALERNGTWDLVPLPPDVTRITCKWVYKVKTRSDGSLEHYKARLVARGFQQEYGIDYEETFAPVAHMTTIQTLLAVAAVRQWSISQLDVNNAFLNGELREEVYMQPPPAILFLMALFVGCVVPSMASSKLLELGLSVFPLLSSMLASSLVTTTLLFLFTFLLVVAHSFFSMLMT